MGRGAKGLDMALAGMDKSKLQKLAEEARMARAGLKELEAVTLAFARWQGMTQESGVDRVAAKAEVDRLLDTLDERPEVWDGMKELIGQSRDDVLAELMVYSMKRSAEQVKEMAKALEAEPDRSAPTPEALPDEDASSAPATAPVRTPGRER